MKSSRLDRRRFLGQLGFGLGLVSLSTGEVTAQMPGDPIVAAFEVRKEELQRRVGSLPAELVRWKARATAELDQQLHFTQIQAVDTLMSAFIKDQSAMLAKLTPGGNDDAFLKQGRQLIFEIIRAQGVWDFYRDKLQLRLSPDFKGSLRVADIAAWDCYRPVLDRAVNFGLLTASQLREPPLCYYVADFSPATWVRDSPIQDVRDPSVDLRDRKGARVLTPIPVIQLPWEHAESLWEFLTIAHEVGHDLEADLKIHAELIQSLEDALKGNPRIDTWRGWEAEIFADLVALQLVGPAYAEVLMGLLLLPKAEVTHVNPLDPHPTHYVRIIMLSAYIRTLIEEAGPKKELLEYADRIEVLWKKIYGNAPHLQDFARDFPPVFHALMDQPLPALGNRSVRSLIPYTAAEHLAIHQASRYLETGRNRPGKLPGARHVLAGAKLAVTRVGRLGVKLEATLREINERTARLIEDNAPKGVLDPIPSARQEFIAGFAKTISVSGRVRD